MFLTLIVLAIYEQFDGFVKEIVPLVVWESRYNIALMEQLRYASITLRVLLAIRVW